MLFISHLPLESAYLGQLYKTKIRSPVAAVLMSGSRLHFFTFTFVLHSAPCIRSPPHHCTVYPFALCTCITNMSMNSHIRIIHLLTLRLTTRIQFNTPFQQPHPSSFIRPLGYIQHRYIGISPHSSSFHRFAFLAVSLFSVLHLDSKIGSARCKIQIYAAA